MDSLYLGLVGAGGALTAICVYFGKKNLDQAAVLKEPIPFSRLAQNAGRCVALRGRPATDAPYLWQKRTSEHWQPGYDKNDRGSWTTDSVDEDHHPFTLHGDAGSVRVWDTPNEVYGTVTHYQGGFSGGLDLGVVSIGGTRSRVTIETLPITHALTVCGRLERVADGWAIRTDPSLGLLLSANEPGSQASSEALKGYLGVLVAPVVWLLGSLFGYRYFHPR